jgi:hypothetical protein
MLRRFLYLQTQALDDYLSALEGGLRDAVQRRQVKGVRVEGQSMQSSPRAVVSSHVRKRSRLSSTRQNSRGLID